jgi:HD-like signal output (HDOD) protein
MEDVVSFAGRAEPLPLDTMAARELLDLFRDPDHDIDRIVEFISQDPWLTAETIKRCNRAMFRGVRRTTDIFEAVSRLGFYELYGIIAASIGSQFSTADAPTAAGRETLRAPAGKLQ